jgi:CRP/FNR family transcriptional regulator, cyclic AMP receptor protein
MPDTPFATDPPAAAPCRHDGALSPDEVSSLTGGLFMSRLPGPLVDAILARVRVWRVPSGEQILRIGQPVEHWLGLASGSALVFMSPPHQAELQCTNWAKTGVWFNLYNPAALTVSDVEVRAEGPTTVAALHADDFALLCARFPELSRQLAVANAGNLRRTMQAVMAKQRATLRQRQLFWLVEMARGQAAAHPPCNHPLLKQSQDALARAHGVSRQAWCEGMKAIEDEGLIRRVDGELTLPDPAALEEALAVENRFVEAPFSVHQRPEAQVRAQGHPSGGASAAQTLRTSELSRVCRGHWFRSLTPSLQQRTLEVSEVRRLAAGETLLRAGEWPLGCWLVIGGAIRLDNPHAQAPHRTIALLPPGAWHSHHDLVYGSPNDFDAVALLPTTLMWMAAGDFEVLFQQDLDYRVAVARLLALEHSQAVRYANCFFWPIETRVGIWLQMMHRYFNMESGAGRVIAASFALEDVAQWLGTTRQAVSRQLKALEADGVIQREQGELVLLQPHRLPQLIS